MDKLERTFIVEEHEEHEFLGFRPEWMPHADPGTGITVPHDMLEHFPDDDGGIEAELMATAAVYLLRYETGWINVDPGKGLSSLDDLYNHFVHEGFTLRDPGKVEPLDDYYDDVMRRIARNGLADVEEETGGLYDTSVFCSEEYRERIVGWLRKGYTRAVERYADVDLYTVTHELFIPLMKRMDEYLKTEPAEGTLVDIVIDFDTMYVSIEAGFGNESDTRECDECDGNGEYDGEDEGNFFDCTQGTTCDPSDPNPDCPKCEGRGYFTLPVPCETCSGSGDVPDMYRESI